MADTIREFLIGFGFDLDEAGERRFVSMIEGATLRANLLADAIENMARVVVDKVAVVAENFEQLYYQSQRIGASANSISAFEDSVKRLGGTAEGARSSLQGFGDFLNNHIGAAGALAKQLGIPLKDTADRGLFLLEVGEKLAQMPKYLATQYRETFHLGDYDTITAAGRAGGRGFYDDSLKRQQEAGLNPAAYKAATEFENKWRDVWDRIGTMAAGGESKLLTALTDPMQKFGKWLDENSPKINEAITNMATAVGSLTIAWVDDLNKVHWNDVATDFEHVTKSISGFVSELTGLMRWLVDFNERSKDWWITKFFNGLTGGGLGSIHGSPEFEGGGDSAPFTEGGGSGGGIWGRVKRFFGFGGGDGAGGGKGPYNYQNSPSAGELTKLITEEAKRAGIDPRIMEGIRAGESGHGSKYDIKDDEMESSWGPFQLNRRRGLGVQFERDTGLDVRDPKTIPDQARWVANYIKEHGGPNGQWMGYRGPRDADTNWGDSGYIPKAMPARPVTPNPHGTDMPYAEKDGHVTPYSEFRKRLDSGASDAPGVHPISWDQGPAWNNLNANLPVGAATTNDNSKAITSSVTNNVTVNAPDPHSAAAMVGLHLDRSANDLARNLQGAHQ